MEEDASPADDKRRLVWRLLFTVMGVGVLYVASSGPILGLSERSKILTFFERCFDFRSRQRPLQVFYSPLAGAATTLRMERIVDHYFNWFGATEATTELLARPLTKSARVALRAGKLDAAEDLGKRAELVHARYSVFDDLPEQIVIEVQRSRLRR